MIDRSALQELRDRIASDASSAIDNDELSERGADRVETLALADLELIDRVEELARNMGLLREDSE